MSEDKKPRDHYEDRLLKNSLREKVGDAQPAKLSEESLQNKEALVSLPSNGRKKAMWGLVSLAATILVAFGLISNWERIFVPHEEVASTDDADRGETASDTATYGEPRPDLSSMLADNDSSSPSAGQSGASPASNEQGEEGEEERWNYSRTRGPENTEPLESERNSPSEELVPDGLREDRQHLGDLGRMEPADLSLRDQSEPSESILPEESSENRELARSLEANGGGGGGFGFEAPQVEALERLRREIDELEPPNSPSSPPQGQLAQEREESGRDVEDDFGRSESLDERRALEENGEVYTEPEDEEGDGAEAEATGESAPARTWRRASSSPNATRLIVGDQDELLCEGMQFQVSVDGFRARVLIDAYYFNDRGVSLEGNFKIRLPNEASLYYFAFGETSIEYDPAKAKLTDEGFLNKEQILARATAPSEILAIRSDTWNQPKEARIVPREQASHAYGETVRRNVDPALVEWAGAGVFNARVFPLQPGKLHRIVIGYDVNLTRVGDALIYSLAVPEDLDQCSIEITAANVPGLEPSIEPEVAPFAPHGRNYYHYDSAPEEEIVLRYNMPASMAITGRDSHDDDYFAADIDLGLPEGELVAGSSHAVFLVDTSLSSRPDRFNIWLDLLRETLDANRDDMPHFAVLFFDVETRWWKEAYTKNTEENVAALISDCQKIALEGATNLQAALAEGVSPRWSQNDDLPFPADLFLLSDGAATWGMTETHAMERILDSENVGVLFAYQTGQTGTATDTLTSLTRSTGGAVFSVTSEEEIAAAATAHRSRPWRLLDVAMTGTEDLLIAGRPQWIYPGQRLQLVGRGEIPVGVEALFHVARGEEQREIRVPIDHVLLSETAPRLYGQVAVGQLEELLASTEEIAIAYARHFRVTGQACSMLMLDTEEDYERFGIVPEEDSFVVSNEPAAFTVMNAIDELGDLLGDPRADLMRWLSRMEDLPGLEFDMPTSLRLAIEQMPDGSFQVDIPSLHCTVRENAQIPDTYFTQLGVDQLSYDEVVAESKRRLSEFDAHDALKALSSLVESNPGDAVLLTDVAYSAIAWDLGGQAYPLLRRVARARPYQPQVYQAMAHCLAEMGRTDLAMIYYELSLSGTWNTRYGEFHRIVGVEYLHFLHRVLAGELETSVPDYVRARQETLENRFDLEGADLIVVMMWNTDRTDIDLHVVEPNGEDCHYGHSTTSSGGHITSDVTQGFGPEMYTMVDAPSGMYKISLHYFGSDNNRSRARTKVYATVYERFGTPEEQISRRVIELSNQSEDRPIQTVKIAE